MNHLLDSATCNVSLEVKRTIGLHRKLNLLFEKYLLDFPPQNNVLIM